MRSLSERIKVLEAQLQKAKKAKVKADNAHKEVQTLNIRCGSERLPE